MAFVNGIMDACSAGSRTHTVPIMIARPKRSTSVSLKRPPSGAAFCAPEKNSNNLPVYMASRMP